VEQLRWARIGTGGSGNKSEGHEHAFWRDGTEKRFVEVELARKSNADGAVARVAGGLRDLLGALLSRFFPRPPLFHFWVLCSMNALIVSFRSAQVDRILI
jgi:hypothetical protein